MFRCLRIEDHGVQGSEPFLVKKLLLWKHAYQCTFKWVLNTDHGLIASKLNWTFGMSGNAMTSKWSGESQSFCFTWGINIWTCGGAVKHICHIFNFFFLLLDGFLHLSFNETLLLWDFLLFWNFNLSQHVRKRDKNKEETETHTCTCRVILFLFAKFGVEVDVSTIWFVICICSSL